MARDVLAQLFQYHLGHSIRGENGGSKGMALRCQHRGAPFANGRRPCGLTTAADDANRHEIVDTEGLPLALELMGRGGSGAKQGRSVRSVPTARRARSTEQISDRPAADATHGDDTIVHDHTSAPSPLRSTRGFTSERDPRETAWIGDHPRSGVRARRNRLVALRSMCPDRPTVRHRDYRRRQRIEPFPRMPRQLGAAAPLYTDRRARCLASTQQDRAWRLRQ